MSEKPSLLKPLIFTASDYNAESFFSKNGLRTPFQLCHGLWKRQRKTDILEYERRT
jgi:hypothetical protein